MASRLAKAILKQLGDNVRVARVVPCDYQRPGLIWCGKGHEPTAKLPAWWPGPRFPPGYIVVCSPLEQAKIYHALEAAQRLWAETAPN